MSQRPSLAFASLSLLVTVAACGGGDDDPASPDAAAAHDAAAPDAERPDAFVPDAMPPADLDCIDTPLPTTATDPIVIDGVASSASINGLEPLAGVTTTAHAVSDDAELDNGGDTGADGVYQLTIANGAMAPIDGYVKGDANDAQYRDTYLYPPFPLAADTDQAPLLFIDDGTFGLFPIITGVTQADDKGLIGLLVLDCAGEPVAGATVTTSPAGTVQYANGQTPDPNATATDASGLAFIFNVTAGDVVVDATADGMSFREHTVNARAGTITTTAVAPGPITPAP